jgi:MFS family permease
MAFIDGSALTVALPALRGDFGADLVSVQWVLNAYVLALASLTLVGGALADVYGKARMLAVGCLLFGLASAACALAPSEAWLIAARAVQGVAAAIVTPASLALIGATYPRDERNQAIGVWAAASALTTAAGPILGGWLTDSFGWPMVFWINPPIAFGAVAILLAFAPDYRREQHRFDVIGAAILAAALGALAWALSQAAPSEPRAAADGGCFAVSSYDSDCRRTRLRRTCRLRLMGAHDRPSDDAATARGKPRLRRVESRNVFDLHRPFNHVFSVAF